MSRIRTIKPEFFRHEELQDLGAEAMLVFAGLWTQCDSKGRFQWRTRQLKLDILPFMKFNMETVLESLRKAGFLQKYDVDGKTYGVVPTFRDHQRISGKELTDGEKYPEPKGDLSGSNREATGKQWGSNGDQQESQEKEKEKERELKEPADAPFIFPSKEEIQESSDPKIEECIQQVCARLYEEKIFPEVHAFKNKMLKGKKNGRGVLHVLTRCYLAKPEDPWAYCQKVIAVEDLNYNERDYRKTAQ